jgi:hypothetical protein
MRISYFFSNCFLCARWVQFLFLRTSFCDDFRFPLSADFFLPFLFFSFCSTDDDTAEYLYDILTSANDSPSWVTQERRVTVGAIQGALQGLRGNGKVYEERVAEALAALQPPPSAT